jgi:hypothetical protein
MVNKVNHYLFLPGCCYMCRSTNLPTIDTEIDLDHPNSPDSDNPSANTRFYICADCAIELARLVSEDRGIQFVKMEHLEYLENNIQSLTSQNIGLQERIEELENALRIVQSIKPTSPDSSPAKKNFKVVTNPDEVEV